MSGLHSPLTQSSYAGVSELPAQSPAAQSPAIDTRHRADPRRQESTRGGVGPRTSLADQAVWWILFLCGVVALITSSYLAWSSLSASPVAGCGGSDLFDCDHVLKSRWSHVLTLPVSIPAIATYLVLLGSLVSRPTTEVAERVRWNVVGATCLAAGGAALWFIALQVAVLQQLCPYCLVAHACGLIAAAVFLWRRPITTSNLGWLVGGVAIALTGLVALQSYGEPPETFEVIDNRSIPVKSAEETSSEGQAAEEDEMLFAPPDSAGLQSSWPTLPDAELLPQWQWATALVAGPSSLLVMQTDAPAPESRTVKVLDGIKLRTKDWPMVGDPNAEMIFVELFDYTCPHCQRTHESFQAAKQHFGDRLGVVTLPLPLDGDCNPTVRSTPSSQAEACELAKLAIAVWLTEKNRFVEFHDYMFDAKPGYSQALAKAKSMVDPSKLEEVLRGEAPSDYVSKHVMLYKRAGTGAIPKLMFPNTTVVGEVGSGQSLIQLIEQNL